MKTRNKEPGNKDIRADISLKHKVLVVETRRKSKQVSVLR